MHLPTVTLEDILKWDRCSDFDDAQVRRLWGRNRTQPVNALEIYDAVVKIERKECAYDPMEDCTASEENAVWAALHVCPEEVVRKYWDAQKFSLLNGFPKKAEAVFDGTMVNGAELRKLLVAYQRKK